MVETAYQRFKHRGAMNTLSITSGYFSCISKLLLFFAILFICQVKYYCCAINTLIAVPGGRPYLLAFDETKGHQQTNSATGTSRALKRQLKVPMPVPAPIPTPAPPPPAPAPAPAPYPGTTPSSLYDAIQLSYHTAQWGFYSDTDKYVPFRPDQSKVEWFRGFLRLALSDSDQHR